MESKVYAHLADKVLSNPVIQLMTTTLAVHGWTSTHFDFNPRSLVRRRHDVRILHFHWPEALWRKNRLDRRYLAGTSFIARAMLAKALGYRLVWSAHNVFPHTAPSPNLELALRHFILRHFDLIIGHAANTRNDLVKTYGTCGRQYILAPHGHYGGYYRPSRSRQEIRRELGFSPIEPVLLLFAGQQSYKGTASFIERWISSNETIRPKILAVGPLPLSHTSHGSRLGIVGGKHVDHNTLADWLEACDVVALPYENITTSGAYFLALTFLKPVIAPNLPFFTANGAMGGMLLYDQRDAQRGIQSAISAIHSGWRGNKTQMKELRDQHDWALSAQRIAAAYNRLTSSPNNDIHP